jgi:bifunctional DNA-binding transcriptional regulator/antitoxin component of YhaV-PrlF toxin-antitoxin module
MTTMFVTSRLDAKVRTVVPKAVREALDLGPGDQICYTIFDGRVIPHSHETAMKKPLYQEDAFVCFDEWASQADTEGYASLWDSALTS